MTTLLALIEQCARRLNEAGVAYGHGTTNALDEAAWLGLWALGLPLDTDLARPAGLRGQDLSEAQVRKVEDLIEQRISTRKPAAYLTREAWLQGVPFYVDERSIVPRSYIAELIADGSLDPWLPGASPRGLDLCTGNGSLAVLAALAWPGMEVDACDLSADALEVARINVQRHRLESRIQLHQGDGLAAVQGCAPYDLILCNPPYVNAGSMAALPAEFRAEPELALAGGADGMDFVRKLLRGVSAHLKPHGLLVLEIGNELEHFEQAFPTLETLWAETSAGPGPVALLSAHALREGQAALTRTAP